MKREARQADTLGQRGRCGAPPRVTAMVVVAHERRVADHRVHPRQPRTELVWRGLREEVTCHQLRASALRGEQLGSLLQRLIMHVNAVQPPCDLARRRLGSCELSRARQEEDALPACGIEHPSLAAARQRPPCEVLRDGIGREERPAVLA